MLKTFLLFFVSTASLIVYPIQKNTATHLNDFLLIPGDVDSVDELEDDESEHHVCNSIGGNYQFDMITYFQNLTNYSALNSHGSCGYVSLIQYLTYYDTFYNDNIIPEAYDRHCQATTYNQAIADSPGVLRQAYPENSSDLYTYVINNKDYDFQALLMYIINTGIDSSNTSYSYKTGMGNYHYISDSLFSSSNSVYSYVQYSDFDTSVFSSYAQSQLEAYVKAQLDLGRPVIMHIINSNYSFNHSVVAYYYDNDGIHYNKGWSSGQNDTVFPDSNASYIRAAGYYDFETSLSHVHSNNYSFGLTNHKMDYCGCGNHAHSFSYSSLSSTKHRKYCACGYSVSEGHIFGGANSDVCVMCGYEK